MTVVLDTTLREGELQPGVYYTREARLAIGQALAEVGTPRIEFPIVYPSRGGRLEEVKDAITMIQQNYTKSIPVIHARAYRQDVELANSYDAAGCAIFMAATGLHRKDKLHGIGKDEIIERFVSNLEFMKDCGFHYRRATVEDASRFFIAEERSEEDTLEFLRQLLLAIQDAGATIISIPDTSGILAPNQCLPFINAVCEIVNIPVACHFHNDYGNALGNALQATFIPGVEEMNVSIIGLGTRNGITDHYEFIANLEDFYDIRTGENRERMRWMYDTFMEATGIPLPLNHPLTSQCFVEKAGTHQSQVVHDPKGYIPRKKILYDAKGTIQFEAGQLMSKQIVATILQEYNPDTQLIINITNEIAARSALRKRNVSPWEVQEIIKTKGGVYVPLEKISNLIRGSDNVYILLKLKPQFTAINLLHDVQSWKEVERVDEVYGDVDVILVSQMHDINGTAVVDKIREQYKDYLLSTVTLPIE
jgi:isopropylmalate/homocitrate/citramalate synthase